MSTEVADESAPKLPATVQFALLAGPLLAMVDSSIMNVAVAPIARELRSDLTTVGWAVSGYLLAFGIGLAATPYLTRRFGTLVVYRASILAFTLASALCTAAPTIEFLLAGRAIQGLVAAPMTPLAMTMLLGRAGSVRAMSPLAGVLLFLGPALGPSVGGALIGSTGWRAIFLVNVPIGLAAALAGTSIPATAAPERRGDARLDPVGMLLLAAGLTLVLFGCERGGTHGWAGLDAWLPLVVGAGMLAGYGRWAERVPHPALDLTLVRDRAAVLALTLCAIASVAMFAAIFLLPVFVQSVQRHNAFDTGLAMLPQGAMTGVSATLGRSVLTRFSVRAVAVAGFAVMAVAGLGLLAIGLHTPLWVTAVLLTGRAAGIGLITTPLLGILTLSARADALDDATTLFNMWQRVAGSLGIGLVAALFAAQSRGHGPVTGLHAVGIVLAGLCVVGMAAALGLPAKRDLPVAGPERD
jgi:EmrB/QacA subfamily drug resistance transporter